MDDLLIQALKEPTWNDYYVFCLDNNIPNQEILGIEAYAHCHKKVIKGTYEPESVFIAKS